MRRPKLPDPFVIRPVTEAEHDAVAELTVSVYTDVLGELVTDEYRAELAAVGHRAARTDVLVAVDEGGRLLGSITFVADADSGYAEFDGPDEAGIRMLVVAPSAQGRGVGTALVGACVERARALGRARIVLRTTESMVAARRLYERLGFVRAPERDEPLPDVVLLCYLRAL